jgi:uncharacterized membrane protein YhhN
MEPSHQPEPTDLYKVKPQEWVYLLGWMLFFVGGVYFVYLGIIRDRSILVVSGSVGIVLGLSEAAVIVIKRLRPWRKLVRITWAIIIIVTVVVIYVMSMLGRPLL